ncbi:MAG: rod shape-determining protein RodA [Chloroflexi bacterium]|nr:rod shape-determining protein RodA [Chloroflexota bacterium]
MKKEIWRNFDYLLFGAVVVLSVFGIVMLQSAIAGSVELLGHPRRQIIFLSIGLVLMIVVAIIDYQYWASLTKVMYLGAVGLLLLVYLLGQVQLGAARWLDTGLVVIQPAELAKVVLILVLADYFSKSKNSPHDLRWIAKSLLILGGMVVWVLLQPNLSMSIVMVVLWFSMIWMSGLKIKHLGLFAVIGLVGGILFFLFVMEDYQKLRIIQFLFPNENARYGNEYNVQQALITIGSGGWFGQGYGQSTQVHLKFLKVRHTDFIFSAMAAEIGFVGTVIVMLLLAFVIIRCIRAARLANDWFGSLVAYGFGILIFFQTAVNIGVNLNVIPVTGLTLPFISYGGSSLLSLLLGIGLVESIVAHRDT